LNPHNPTIQLQLARLEVANSDLKAARVFVNQAIAEKPNYAEAHFLLAQIEVTEGNLDKATVSLETTLLLSPQDPGLFFQLGLLKYNAKNFNGAVEAFQQAITLVPDYANAKYFLGLSFANLGKAPEAIAQFEDIEKSNPGNAEVALILANLRAGKEPFANAKPPLDSKPENRPELPLKQAN
jgi:tetratricopeptide (TPR) repeat protein